MIHVRGLMKSYQTKFQNTLVLRDVNFDIPTASIIAITGTSGCGKSTLLNAMCGLIPIDSGSIIVDNTEISKLSLKDCAEYRLRNYGLVFQDFRLISTLNVRENILLPMCETQGFIDEAWYRTVLNVSGLDSVERNMPFQLSGGEQQRTAIARALITKPKYLFADEPTGNLDQDNTNRVMSFLVDMAKREKITLVFVTHDMELCNYADDVLCIQDRTIRAK